MTSRTHREADMALGQDVLAAIIRETGVRQDEVSVGRFIGGYGVFIGGTHDMLAEEAAGRVTDDRSLMLASLERALAS